MNIPAFHPDWLVTFWLTTPVLNRLNPHITLIIVVSVLFVVFFSRKKYRVKAVPDPEEERFKLLIYRKQMIEKELTKLASESVNATSPDEQVAQKKTELERMLDRTTKELQQYTL